MTSQSFLLAGKSFESRINGVVDTLMNLPRDHKWEVTVSEFKRSRSEQQNRLYWRWLEEIAQHTGEGDKDAWHDYFRTKFLGKRPVTIKGELIEVLPSTTKLNVSEMSEYMNHIQRECEPAGIMLTQPDGDSIW